MFVFCDEYDLLEAGMLCSCFVMGMIYWRPGCCARVFLQCFCDGYDLLETGMLCLCFVMGMIYWRPGCCVRVL